MPAGEKPHYLERAWERVREEVAAGHQAYVVCPRIGGDDQGELQDEGFDESVDEPDDDEGAPPRPLLAVLDVAPLLAAGPLAGLRVEVLHGRLPADEKDDVMRRFAAGDVDVLVATTVVEVGVDVANATVMVVMDADRFGVSQLHQLRGRVGRGSAPGLCLLVTDLDRGPRRGPGWTRSPRPSTASSWPGSTWSQRREGDVLGATQSGRRSSLRLLRVLRDEDVIQQARVEATALVELDPDLADHPALRSAVAVYVDDEQSEYLEKA